MKKVKKTKNNLFAFIVVAIVGVGIIVGIMAYAFYVSANIERPFVHARRIQAQRLYDGTVGQNIEANYPTTPRRVMELYLMSFRLLHGDFIAMESMFFEVIDFQRLLFSEELLERAGTREEQFATLMENLDIIAQTEVTIRSSELFEINLDYRYENTALAQVRHNMLRYEDLYRLYFLQMDENDKWRIHSWRQTNSNFDVDSIIWD